VTSEDGHKSLINNCFIPLLIRRSLVRAQVEEPTYTTMNRRCRTAKQSVLAVFNDHTGIANADLLHKGVHQHPQLFAVRASPDHSVNGIYGHLGVNTEINAIN
jgi:hypothetical protein